MKIIHINRHYIGRDAHRDWVIIFIVTCVISGILIISGVKSYGNVYRDLSSQLSQPDNAKLPFEPNSLDNAIKVINSRATNQKATINATIPSAPL